GDHLAFDLAVGLRGRAEPFFAVGNIVHHPGLRRNSDAVADFQMTRQAGLAGNDGIITDLRAARDAHLRNHEAPIADDDVVRDLHEVINLRALSDDRRTERAAIDTHVGTDLNIVANDD